ncbi:MAG: hypothetical protein GC204_05290 [Chloroflexi bacterium]|nr:hypothetical protein [Chloroflexota bacterium]
MDKQLQFEPFYPDVLGAIAGDLHVSFEDVLQAAVGLFPHRAYLNQPIEIIVILQNMVDQNMDVKVALHLPSKAADGTAIMISAPKKMVSLTLTAGEVGVLRMPIVAVLPTQPANDLPVQVAIRYRARNGKAVRSPTRGAPPSALSVSPFKLQVLRDIEWVDQPQNLSPENITVRFDVAPKRLPSSNQTLKPNYEVLWSQQQMKDERRNILGQMDGARLLATSFTRMTLYDSIYRMVDDVYAGLGLPLHPGEVSAISKMLIYTMDDRSQLDPAYKVEEQRWFQVLCQVLAHDPAIAQWTPGEIVTHYLFDAAMYDAILLAFTLIRSRVKVNLGDRAERISYANKVMRWLAGQADPDLVYIYLPLALGGVVVNHQVTWGNDNPWYVIDGLREAYRGRVRLVEGDAMEIFDMLDKLLERGEDELRRSRVQR